MKRIRKPIDALMTTALAVNPSWRCQHGTAPWSYCDLPGGTVWSHRVAPALR